MRWQANAWATAIRDGLQARGIPIEQAAERAGVPVSTFRTWLDGRHLPRVTLFDHWSALAGMAGLSESELLRIAGILPDAFANSLLLGQAARELRDGIERTHRLLRQTSVLTQSSAVSQVINELSTSGVDWEIRLRSAIRGNEIRLIYHHYVGIVPPEQLRGWHPNQIRDYIQNDVLTRVWSSLGLYWRVAEVHDWENAPDLLIQVPEQESSRPPSGRSPRPDGHPVLVLSLPWGYGELLGSLVADGLGFGNIDFRYLGLTKEGDERTRVVQFEINNATNGYVMAIPPLMLLTGLDIAPGRLSQTVPVVMTYGRHIRDRASQVYRVPLESAAGQPNVGIAMVESRHGALLNNLPTGKEYLQVEIADEDVMVGDMVNLHRMSDTVAWAALAVTQLILTKWETAPLPVGGPLHDLILPSGRLRQPPQMMSKIEWRTVE